MHLLASQINNHQCNRGSRCRLFLSAIPVGGIARRDRPLRQARWTRHSVTRFSGRGVTGPLIASPWRKNAKGWCGPGEMATVLRSAFLPPQTDWQSVLRRRIGNPSYEEVAGQAPPYQGWGGSSRGGSRFVPPSLGSSVLGISPGRAGSCRPAFGASGGCRLGLSGRFRLLGRFRLRRLSLVHRWGILLERLVGHGLGRFLNAFRRLGASLAQPSLGAASSVVSSVSASAGVGSASVSVPSVGHLHAGGIKQRSDATREGVVTLPFSAEGGVRAVLRVVTHGAAGQSCSAPAWRPRGSDCSS